ncbi:MAG TPA: hypothetical protein VE033_12520 [Acetobacteraceae bacterium]|nr:hypothetical protein [Acetobacteraceae bacterium]
MTCSMAAQGADMLSGGTGADRFMGLNAGNLTLDSSANIVGTLGAGDLLLPWVAGRRRARPAPRRCPWRHNRVFLPVMQLVDCRTYSPLSHA